MHGHAKRRGVGGGRAIVDAMAILTRERGTRTSMLPARGLGDPDRVTFRPSCTGYGEPYSLPASGTIPGERIA